jgi:Na/Pi-cotransporter
MIRSIWRGGHPIGVVALFFICSALLSTAAGCSDERGERGRLTLRAVSGADQCTADPAGVFHDPLRIEARSGRTPRPGVRLVCAPEAGSHLVFSPAHGVTDAGGVFETRLTGTGTGDQFFTVRAPEYPGTELRLRVAGGVELSGDGAEALAGRPLPKPVAVRLVKDGRGVPGVPVRFAIRSSAEGADTTARVDPPFSLTDADGIAAAHVTLGKATGRYRLGVDVDGGKDGFLVRDREITLVAVDPWRVTLTVLGGVAFFIFGMGLMSDGLRAAAGNRLKGLLQFFTGNRVSGMLAGAAVTAGLQSSAAVTVMVTGFINAGLLTLKQALGIIFGANIGTTVTAQIISFDLSGAALPAVALGLALTFTKNRVRQGFGRALLGFGILFFGLTMMSNELKVLAEIPTFRGFFVWFDCTPAHPGGAIPVWNLLGALLLGFFGTALLQSSSAFTGVVLALAAGGLVDFNTAFVLLLGSNVGTTVTTLLASARLNRVARQAALAHFIFNTFGAVLMAGLLYIPWGRTGHPVFLELVNALTPGDVFAAVPQNPERHIAMAHTLFNLSVALLLLPFVTQFEWLCNKLLPIRDAAARRIRILEPGLLNTPPVAVKQCVTAIREMVKQSWVMIDRSLNEHFLGRSLKDKRLAEIARMENEVDDMQREITDYLVLLMRKPLTRECSELIPLLMHATNDAERIADHAENIIELAKRLEQGGDKLSENAVKSLEKLWRILDDEAGQVITGLDGTRRKPVKSALKDERKINKLAEKLESDHIERLRKGECAAPAGVIYIEMLGELEKIGDRLTNIAERTPQIQQEYVKL